MATSQLSGVNFSHEGNTVEFFGAKGVKFDSGNWGVNAFGGEMYVEVDPDSIMDRVRGCIEEDVKAGNIDQVAQLQLRPRQAVVFFLEGKLTRAHLQEAVEGPNHVDIPNVEVEGRTLTVRVQPDLQHYIATADSEGNVL